MKKKLNVIRHQVSAGFPVCRLLNLSADGPEHGAEATLAAGQRQDSLDGRVDADDVTDGRIHFPAVEVKSDIVQWNTLKKILRLKQPSLLDDF
jgi:hypothetical protein